MSQCFECKYFKQTGPLDFEVSGYCNWMPHEPVPAWMQMFLTYDTDNFYGPQKKTGKDAYAVKDCSAFLIEEYPVILKRRSEEWYE